MIMYRVFGNGHPLFCPISCKTALFFFGTSFELDEAVVESYN